MRRNKKGFTMVEVSLFLAITGLLFLSVTIGVQNSIYQQRYNDTVQSFADFMRNVYDGVMNVQTASDGRHEMAVYGKLVSFRGANDDGKQIVYVYDVIGRAISYAEVGSDPTLTLLKNQGTDVIFREGVGEAYKTVGIVETYEPSWGARIQKIAKKADNSFEDFTGVLLVVRDPKAGTVRTFVGNDVASSMINDGLGTVSDMMGSEENHILTDYLTPSNFSVETVDFCVNPNGANDDNRRTDVRLLAGAANASGVEIIGLDDNDPTTGNQCNK